VAHNNARHRARKAAPAGGPIPRKLGGPIARKSGGSIPRKSGGPIPRKSGGSNHRKSCTTTRDGIRDRAMMHLCFAAALRVSELVGVRLSDVTLQPSPSVLIRGKGRRERCLPLWKETVKSLRAWLAVRQLPGQPVLTPELFTNARGAALSRSGFEYILCKHVQSATKVCPSLSQKRVSPHVLRHTAALFTLQATRDLRKVSLWLGHSSLQTTEIYTRADQSVKLEILESAVAPKLRSGRFRASDKLIASLRPHNFMRSRTSGTCL
jgi:integrase/recombinase XerD